jgi:hypothetical protein
MKHPYLAAGALYLFGAFVFGTSFAATWLGNAPIAIVPPEESVAPRSASVGRSVVLDPHNRNQVAQAYQTIYLAQANVPIGWTGNIGSCNPGTDSLAYQTATIERVNFYRALSGLPGNITLLGATEQTDTQAAALMFSANQMLSHDPPPNWLCYTAAGHTGAGNSNIALGFGNNAAAGPGAVDLYMDDGGSNNTAVGHRRWVQYPPQAQMASGSIPYNPQWASNALWVFGPMGSRPPTPNGVSWPPQGYVPWQLLPESNRWSFSWNNASFANTTVSMTRDGIPLGAPSYETVQNGYGDNTLVWLPQGVTYSQPGHDVVYHVVISGISGGGAPPSIAYDVIVIDPFVLGDRIFEDAFDP